MNAKFRFFIIFAFMSLLPSAVAHPAEEWNRTYRDLGWGISDIAPAVVGGYVLAAYDSTPIFADRLSAIIKYI